MAKHGKQLLKITPKFLVEMASRGADAIAEVMKAEILLIIICLLVVAATSCRRTPYPDFPFPTINTAIAGVTKPREKSALEAVARLTSDWFAQHFAHPARRGGMIYAKPISRP